ncbi:general transcription factor 3C polypeptide 1 [Anoplophora glabripennis]|nr:general transcription factor 3C polypeptide 1 [Anoplophora glabripennis]
MGKSIEQKYSDVSHRIIKKSVKKEKHVKKSPRDVISIKRKLPSIEDNDQPSVKLVRTENVGAREKPALDLSQITLKNQDEVNCSQIYAAHCCGCVRLEITDSNSRDLFLHDELSDSYENYINNDFGFQIVDEISLEGLDGITIEAFWKRLSVGFKRMTYISDDLKQSIWRLICSKRNLQFFKLPNPRGVLDIYDRLKYLDADIGVVMELAFELPDIYPHELVNDDDVQGSCSTFKTRTDITMEVKDLDLKTAEQKFGTSLAIVANQTLRKKALIWESADPIAELVNMEYCILERIGRSRRHGELTQGNMSIGSHFKMDPKSVYHYKKQLVQYDLLAKQFFYIKSAVIDQNKTGKLLHLKRFYHKIKPKQLLLAEQIVNVMKERPDCRIEFSELKKIFEEFAQPVAKVIKSPEFRKYIKTELVCYRDIYPNAEKTEYMRKSKPIEKFIKCVELINPHVNITASWSTDQDDSDDDNDDGEEESTGGRIHNMECFKEVYYHIMGKGKNGCTSQEIQKLMGVDSNTIRMCMKKLVTSNIVTVKKFDQGKQRHLIYYARFLEPENVRVKEDPQPPKPTNNVLEKLKQRQRAAIEKSNQTPAGKGEASIKTMLDFNWNLERIVPKLTCHFFIRNLQNLICSEKDTSIITEFIPMEKNFLVKLNTRFPKTDWIFEINKVLNEISCDIIVKEFKANLNPDSVITPKNDTNYLTKLILLKASFGDIAINATTLNCFTRKRQQVNVPVLSDMDRGKSKMGNTKLQYMGAEPMTVFNDKDNGVCVEISVSTPPPAFKNDVNYPNSKDLSERVVSRIRIILRVVYEKKIFEEVFKLIKVVEEEELKEGYTKKMDRKSLSRILKRLVDEGYLKIYKLTISDDKLTKVQTFVCHPSINHTDSLIMSACQQLKWKYFVGAHKKSTKTNVPTIQKNLEAKIQKTVSPFNQSDVMSSVLELKELNRLKRAEATYKPSRLAGKTYGFKPKFIRMRIIHEFLHYLIYAYDRDTKPLTELEVENLFESYRINVTKEDLRQIPSVYCSDINWKMFIPPLPHHGGWMAGWALMCDIILRLPISVLCKIHNVAYDVPELLEILNHSIKRFYLVKDLPEGVRMAVLSKRKYLFNIHDSMCRLAWCGLVQFGPQKYKEKDQVFIFLNRMASLYDTVSSEPAYNKITNKEYRKLAFYFNSQADIDSYWYNAYGICLSTKLNSKQGGQLVTIFDPQSRPELIKALKSKTPEEALKDDNGEIPGDKRGASGFDSSLWSHIMKNWFWAPNQKNAGNKPALSPGLRKEKLEMVLPKNLSYNELNTIGQTNKIYLHKTKEGKETKPKLRKYVHVPLKPSKTVQKITRRIPFRAKFAKRQYTDPLDKVILKRIGVNVRVKWNHKEDRVLLLSLAACIFLNPRFPRKQSVPYSVVRDVLHRLNPDSRNKTSKAVQRRMKIHLAPRHRYLEDNVLNLLELKPISEYFTTLVNNLTNEKSSHKSVKYTEAQLSTAYIILMSYLVKHQQDIENILQGNLMNIDYLTGDRLDSTKKNVVPLEEGLLKYKDVENEDDIKRDVLKSVIHSSLGCTNRPGWTFQLFKIYQKYSDNLICEALAELKRTQAISFNKFVTKKAKNRWHTPFQLSNLYVISQSSTFSNTTAIEAYKTFLNLKENKKLLDFSQETIESKKYGQLLGLNEFCSFWDKVRFNFYLPRTMVILNPHVKDHGELVDELAARWLAKLKKMFQDNTETELEQDNDGENRSKSHDYDGPSTSKEEETISDQRHTITLNDNQNNPLDLTVDDGNSETIDRLKTWLTDCMETEQERRSPSPEFMQFVTADEAESGPTNTEVQTDHHESYDEVDKINMYNVKKILTKEQIPTLEEIKEGMLRYTPPSEERILIPYITDLCFLLTRDYTDLNTDEEKIERLKNHFITQYAVLEDVVLGEAEELPEFYMVEYIQSGLKNKRLWERIKSKLVIKKPSGMSAVYRLLEENNGRQADFYLANRIVDFIFERKSLGVAGPELKEEFGYLERNCSLETILQALVDSRILLRTGVCSLTFVHHLHQSPWLVETFTLSNDEQKFLEEKASSHANVKEKIDKQLQEKTLISISVMPWIKVDGTLNEETFKIWLCNVLSHCLNCPKIMFMKLCEKFCYVKPVDIYFLLEALQELGCVELFIYEHNDQGLFSDWEHIKERNATFLDHFENMYVLPNNASMTCMGSFFYEE